MTDEGVMARSCAWCSALAPMDATTCPACGAAMAQRESIGDLRIPGVTDIRADLLDADGRPLHIPGASNAQGMAGGAMVAALAGGPVGLAALGGMAAVTAGEYLAAQRAGGRGLAVDAIGRPSDAVLEMIDHLDHDGGNGDRDAMDNDPWRDEPGRQHV